MKRCLSWAIREMQILAYHTPITVTEKKKITIPNALENTNLREREDRYGGNELKCKDKIIVSFGSQKEDSVTT